MANNMEANGSENLEQHRQQQRTNSHYSSIMLRTNDIDPGLQLSSSICACLIVVCSLLGIFGNIASIFIFSRRHMRSSIAILLIGLSAVDLCLIFLSLATFGVQGFSVLFNASGLENFIAFSAVTTYPVAMTLHTISVWLLVIITVERYTVVCHPFSSRKLCTTRRAKLSLLAIACAAFLYNLIRFWEYDAVPIAEYHQQFSAAKYEAVELLRREERYFHFYFIGLYLIVHFFCPFLLLTVLNAKIVITVKKSNTEVRISNRQYREHRIAIMMIVIVVVFVLCNTIPFILNIVEGFKRDLFTDSATHFIAYIVLDVSNLLVVVNSSVTMLIYYGFSQRYRDMFKAIFCRRPWPSASHNILQSALSTALIIPVRISNDDQSTMVSTGEWWWSKLRWSRMPSFASVVLSRKRFNSEIGQHRRRRNISEPSLEVAAEAKNNPSRRLQTVLKIMTPTFKWRSNDVSEAAEEIEGEIRCELVMNDELRGYKSNNANSCHKKGTDFL